MADSQNLKDSKQESKAFVDFSSTNKAASSSSNIKPIFIALLLVVIITAFCLIFGWVITTQLFHL